MAHVLTTDAVAPRQRVAYWQEMVCETFVQARCESSIGESFRGSISTEAFEGTEISRIEAGPQRIHRRAVDIARACKPRYYLCYHAAGHARYRERNVESVLGPGDLILLDNCEPYLAEYQEPVTSLVLHVPPELLRARIRFPERVQGRRIGASRGLARVAGDFLQSCLVHAGGLPPAQRPLLAQTALNLLAGVIAEDQRADADPGLQQALCLTRIKQYVHAHMHEPGLDPSRAAAAHGVSVRYLQRLFQIDGLSFGRYLLQQRIERCRCALENPAQARRQVSAIALDHGFNNLAHFSRVFREASGCSPSEYRAASAGAAGRRA